VSQHTRYAKWGDWEVWVGKFQFDGWDCFVRRSRGVPEEELVPGGPFPSRPEAGEAGMIYVRTNK